MLVSKGKFAEMVGRTPAAVSQWIAGGKLSGAALVGEGRFAQVNVEVALQQLGITLDLGQQLAQSAPILSGATLPAPAPAAAPMAAEPSLFSQPQLPPAPAQVDDDQRRLLAARADREELARAKDIAAAKERDGEWMVTAKAEEAWSAQLARIVQAMESWLVTSAATRCASIAASDEAKTPRAYAVALRQGFERLCARLSKEAAGDADAIADDEADEP